jgi:hypothetical protein
MMGLAHCLVPRSKPWCASTSNVQLSLPSGPSFPSIQPFSKKLLTAPKLHPLSLSLQDSLRRSIALLYYSIRPSVRLQLSQISQPLSRRHPNR